jgi:membrane fusion protein (multidrug efflux system)
MAKISTPLRWLLVLLVVGAGLMLPRWLASRDGVAEPEGAEAEPRDLRIPVGVETVRPMPIEESLAATGTLLADERVEVVSEVAGKVEEVLFDEGSLVSSGQVLVRLDTVTQVAERDRAFYRFELTERHEARQRKLLDEGLLSQEEYDFTVGELNVLRSELELRNAMLEKAEIRAPFAGRAGLRYVSPGAFVTPQTRLTTIQVLDPVKVEFAVPESYARVIAPGASIRFRVQGLPDTYQGTVYATEPAVDPETRSLTVRARSPNPGRELIPGTFAEVELAVRGSAEALSVPAIAVIPELGGKKVFVLEDGKAVSRPVETGIRTASRVEIVEGLEAGEQVIVSNVARVTAGVEVVVRDEEEAL